MTTNIRLADQIARDLFEFNNGALISISTVARFLGQDRGTVAQLVRHIKPCTGENTAKRYYFRQIAEVIAEGRIEDGKQYYASATRRN